MLMLKIHVQFAFTFEDIQVEIGFKILIFPRHMNVIFRWIEAKD